MAQRNPMNDRYQGDGPQGKTRKSAAKLKPKTEAASSVHIERKPQTKQEKKAAQKKREKELAAKEAERLRKKREREKLQLEKAGIVVEEQKKPATMVDSVKEFFGPSQKVIDAKKDAERAAMLNKLAEAEGKKGRKKITDPDREAALSSGKKAAEEVVTSATKKEKPVVARTGSSSFLIRKNAPNTPEYRRYRIIYFTLMGIGAFCLLSTFAVSFLAPHLANESFVMIPVIVAYVTIISSMGLDFFKIRKMEANYKTSADKRSPKQIKHEQKQAEAAALIEEAKKAKKEQRREKIPFIGKSKTASEAEQDEDNASDESDVEETANVDEISKEDEAVSKEADEPNEKSS